MKAPKKSRVPRGSGSPKGWPARESLDKFLKVVSGVIPLLDAVKESLEESTGSIPKASRQLDNVTKATESATVEILDLLERMSARVDRLGTAIAGVRAASGEGETRLAAMDALVATLEQSHPEVHACWNDFRKTPGFLSLPAGIDVEFDALRTDTMNIGMALQVQDITTQQIAGVSHMIESIRMKLTEVLQSFNDGEMASPPELAMSGPPDPNGRFNGDAEYSRAPERQENADEIVESWKRGNHG